MILSMSRREKRARREAGQIGLKIWSWEGGRDGDELVGGRDETLGGSADLEF